MYLAHDLRACSAAPESVTMVLRGKGDRCDLLSNNHVSRVAVTAAEVGVKAAFVS